MRVAVRRGVVIVGVVAAFVALVGPAAAQAGNEAPNACIPASQCCRICHVGKACGNSCIQATRTCHKGRGCACNAGEVCP
jgi:hypothetical protein